jgi:hypothetical protein
MEINDALVTAITRELLKRLGGEACASLAEKKPLVLAGGTGNLRADTLASLEAGHALTHHNSLDAVFPDSAEVVVTKLSIQALVRIAEGDAGCTPEGAALLWALLRGKKPVILEEGVEWRAHKDTMSPALAARYNACERVLASYGAVFTPESGLSGLCAGCCADAPKPAAASQPQVFGAPSNAPRVTTGTGQKKRVISEIDLIKLCPASAGAGQIVEIGPRDILTPLAEDYVSKMRITVNRIA